MRERHVVLYSDTGGVGGAEEIFYQVARHVDRSAWSPRVVLPSGGELGPLIRRFQRAGIQVDQLPLAWNLRWQQRLWVSYRYFRKVRPDVLYINRPSLDSSIPGILGARLARIRRIIVYDLFPFPVAGYPGDIKTPSRVELHTRRFRPRLGLGQKRAIAARRLPISFVDAVMVPSDATREVCVRDYQYPRERTRTVHHGVDVEDIVGRMPVSAVARRGFGIAADVPVLLCSARLSVEKGHAVLLAAMPRIRETVPSARLLLAGQGPLRAELESMSAALGCNGAVEFLGWRGDIPALLSACDMFVLPSLWDPFPITNLEAMACGRAIVTSRTGGIPEAVIHGETGLLVPPGDSEALASAVIDLLASPEKRFAMGAAGRRRVEACFPLTRMLSQIYHLWDG